MYDNLHIEEMRNALGNKTEITIKDIDDFYCRYSPDIPFSTVKWRIHSLIDKGVLHRIGHGRYRFGEEKVFSPDIFRKTMDIARIMRKQFPFADYCQWNFSAVNAFVHHLLNTELFFVDVERDAREAVYYAIRDKYPKTVLSSNLNDELAYYDGCIVVRNLITDAPVITVEDIPMASIEKILVDLALDAMFPFQNIEMLRIFENACSSYAVNISRMLRYAGRRGRRAVIEEILNEIDY